MEIKAGFVNIYFKYSITKTELRIYANQIFIKQKTGHTMYMTVMPSISWKRRVCMRELNQLI